MSAHLLSAPARKSTPSARCLSATLLALAAGTVQAATLDSSTDFHVTVNTASSDQTFPAGYYGEITVGNLLAQDSSASGDGIALTTIPSTLNGIWYYSSYDASNVLTWTALSYTNVSTARALVLPKQTAAGAAYSLRFVPNGAGFNTTTTFASPLEALTFVSCDGQPAEQLIDTTQNQAVSLYSGAIHLNRAPAIKTTSSTSVSVDQTNGIIQKVSLTTATAGLTIDNLINDDDALAYYGIAVTSTSQGSNGTSDIGAWHFTYTNSDGISSDQDLTFLGDGIALLAGSTYRSSTSYPVSTLSFVFNSSAPETIDPDNPPAITYYAWDMTDSGTSYGDIVFVSPGNAITLPSLTPAGAYSLASAQVVIALNHAPAATSGPLTATCNSVTLTSNADGTTVVPLMGAMISTPVNTTATAARALPAPVQLTVDELILSAGASDADSNTLGILVTSAAYSGLFYSTDGGNTLTQITDGTYLTADALLYVQPATVGSQTSNLTFQIWDQTDGAVAGDNYFTRNETVISPTGGGITAFSSAAVSVSISFDAIPSVTVSPSNGTLFSTTVGATPSWQVFGSSSYSNDSLTLAQTSTATLPAWLGTLATITGTGAITAYLSAAQAVAPSDAGEDFTVTYAMSDGTASDVALAYEFVVAPYFTSDGTAAYDPIQAVTTAAQVGSSYQSELLAIRIQPGQSLSALSVFDGIAQAAQTRITTTSTAMWSSLTVSYDTLTANDQGLVFFRITGAPTSEGNSTVVVNAEFLAANQTPVSSSQTFSIIVDPLTSVLTLTGTHSIGAIVGHPLSLTVHASTSLAQVIPSISLGDAILPAGLTLTDNGDGSATIAGTPTEASAPRSIVLTATDGVSTTSASFQLVISANPASVTEPTLPVATGNATPTYATVGLATPEAVDSFLAAITGKDNTQVRAFAYSATAQQYVELPSQPAEGLLNHALFVVTRIDLPFSLDGTPLPLPTSLTLQPGWNFLTIPAITTDGSDTVTSHPWSGFLLTDADGVAITNPIDAIGTVGSGDLATTQPYTWTGSGYVHTDMLTSGVGYWFKNNTASPLLLTRQSTTGNLVAASLTVQAMRTSAVATTAAATVVDRGTPPNPPSESSASSADSGSSSGCGLGSGVAGFGLLLLAGLRAALRRATAGRSTRP